MQKMTHRITTELRQLAFENHDHCVSCGYVFRESDTSHLGYDEDKKPLYVCDNCAVALKETAIRHYFSPHPYVIPEPSSKLWRYMDFTKYVSMLSTGSLYFTRSDCFEDTFEGAKGLRKNKEKWDNHYLSFFRNAIKNPPEGNGCNFSDDEIDKQARKLLADLEAGGEVQKKRVFVSCWHENEHESEAMWRLYSSFLANAVAVRTSYKRLYEALGRSPDINIGRISYIDLNKSYAGVNEAFWKKRLSFQHEKEVRAIIIDRKCEYQGKLMVCNLSTLIEEVYVSPKAPVWFANLVNDVNSKYGIKVNVSTSELNQDPFF